MKNIDSRHITAGFLILVTACLCLAIGFFHWVFFVPAALLVICYFIFDKNYLRCPHCGVFTNLDRLFYAKTHTYHCHGCGKTIHVKTGK